MYSLDGIFFLDFCIGGIALLEGEVHIFWIEYFFLDFCICQIAVL